MITVNRRNAWLLVLFVGFAAGIRGLALWADRDSLLYQSGGLDAAQYIDMARRFSRGQWPSQEPFFWAPGYPVFLGLLNLISAKVLWFKAVQLGLGTMTCVLVGIIASELFGNPRVTALSAGIAALYGPLVYYDLQISPASLDVFLYMLLLVLLLQARRRASAWLWLAAGIVAAASAMTRGAALLLLPVVLVWMWHDPRRGGEARPFSRVLRPLALVGPVLLVVALVLSHNHRYDGGRRPDGASADQETGGGLLISYNFGINFLLGNVPESYATNHVEHPLCFLNYKLASYEPILLGHSRPSAQSRFLFERGVRWIAQHPVDWLRLMGSKAAELLHGSEISRDTSIYAARIDNGVLWWLIWKRGIAFPSGLLVPFALLGLAFAPREPRRHFLIVGALASQAVFVLAFFVTTRYRLALCASAIPYAAYALVAAAGALRSENQRTVVLAAALGVVLFALSNHDLGKMPSQHLAFERDYVGSVLDHQGRHEEAVRQWRAAVALDPSYASAHFQLANYYAKQNDLGRAEAHYTKGLRAAPLTFPARVEYAKLLVHQKRPKEAAEQIGLVVSRLPSSSIRQGLCVFAALESLDVQSACSRLGPSGRNGT